MEVHVVQKGDTLWKISRQYGISFEDLKRVNAHLANPDYIVPGMKIFLPDKMKGKGEVKQPSTGAGQVQKTEKAPVKKPEPPKEKPEVPKQPKPLPEVPTPPKVPPRPPAESKPVPPKPKPEKPAPKPIPPKEPISPPVQSQPMPPMPTPPMQPYPPFSVIGIPCGWLPIYDADCYPHMHPSQMQPMPSPMPQLPVHPESSHFPGHHLPTKPTKPKVTDDWKMIESPKIEEELIVQRPKRAEPKPKPESTPEPTPIPLPLPQYEMPMPQPVAPMQQNHWRCMQCGVQPSYSGHSLHCGCGSFQPMPMPMPMQHPGHCNACQQPIQRMPQMMPFPHQNNNWYGTH